MNLPLAAWFFRSRSSFVGTAAAWAFLSAVSGFAQTVQATPADRAAVIAAYGPPSGTMRAGEREILSYPDRSVVLVEGRVVSSTLTPPAPAPRPTPTPAAATSLNASGSGVDGRSSNVPTPLPLRPERSSTRSPTPMPTRYYPARPTPPPSAAEALISSGQNFIQVAKGAGRLYYDPQVWRELKSPNGEMRALSHRSADLHVVMNAQAGNFALSDPASMLLGRLRAREPQALVLRQEKRNVKGGEVTFLSALGSPAPARVEYIYYVHCGTRFATVLMVLGPQTAAEQNAADVAKLLEGFEIPDANAEASPL